MRDRARRIMIVLLFGMGLLATGSSCRSNKDGGTSLPSSQSHDDRSLTTEEYVKRGMTTPDKAWKPNDYEIAVSVLQSMASADPGSLPRYKSPKSGAIFRRITAKENLDVIGSNPSLEFRFPMFLGYFEQFKECMKPYVAAGSKGQPLDDEIVELHGMLLRLASLGTALTNEFLPTIPKDDPSYQVRMAGLEKWKMGMAGIVVGSLGTLAERQYYGKTCRLRLIGYLKEFLPLMISSLSAEAQKEITNRIATLAQEEKDEELKKGLSDLSSAVAGAGKPK